MFKPKSLKHIKRYRQIASVLAQYGLKDLLYYVKTFRLPRPLAEPKIIGEAAQNLRLALQELGPTFIKGGQLLSSRSDILPRTVTNELYKLLDEVEPVGFEIIKEKLVDQYGTKYKTLFARIDEEPLASASLAQVHKARLKNGKEVVLKIQRPGIKKLINVDINIMYDFAIVLQDRLGYLGAYNLVEIVREFKKNLMKELDFELEGLNMQTVSKNLNDFKCLKIPKIYFEYTTKEILCLDFIEGLKITQKNELVKTGLNLRNVAKQILDIYSKQIYIDGFFQADPHIGNIFIKEDGLLQLIDFGSTGKLDENLRKEIATLVFHFIFKEGEQAAESLLRLGSQKAHTNYTALRNDVSAMVAEYTTLPAKYFNIGQGFIDLTKIANKHNIEVPASFSLVGKTFLLLDDIVRQLDPEFNYNDYLTKLIPVLLYERLHADYSPDKIVRNTVELGNLASSLPAKLNYFIEKVLKDDVHVIFRHEGLEKVSDGLTTAGFAIALALLAAGLSLLTVLSFLAKLYLLTFVLGLFVVLLITYLCYQMLRKIRW